MSQHDKDNTDQQNHLDRQGQQSQRERAAARDEVVTANPWQALRRFTAARIALGRSGVSLPTAPQLDFQLAHARARDAVHLPLDHAALAAALTAACGLPCLALHSAAQNRHVYLQRPDLGRRLDEASRRLLQAHGRAAGRDGEQGPRGEPGPGRDDAAAAAGRPSSGQPVAEDRRSGAAAASVSAGAGYDLAFVIADGLSALAIEQNALPFLRVMLARLAAEQWSLAPLALVDQGRVAVGDEVGQLLGARAVVVLVGERPGLSSPDSMGLYLTWAPQVGLTDASRNCISNVRPAGLRYEEAAYKLHYLLEQSRLRQLSGVALKDETGGADGALAAPQRNFLLDLD
ncbi:ethanolamine ammonia-lyase subunit EutC [Rugamonas sp. DEMB1]|uniref:ethanolamine ammonia-lyase subunit EutC n=1 Tax=Rugamonas sp. DEMB1 TaxID=3039386 RepID=UPI00244ABF80|nr:ethanolamine ammonia-lyase subunit EutC [Rugamonas sp. DEMB1]WGG50802.1 ethanolamine ammonia-lyase subunit EutC [Rugamonas sp. DEMB1]